MVKSCDNITKPDGSDMLSVEELQDVISQKDQKIKSQAALIKLLEEKLRLATLKRFAASSEKMPFQIDFFDEAELEVALDDLDDVITEESAEPESASSRKKKPKKGFSDKLPRVRIDLALSDEEKAGALNTFFTKVKEELDIIPARARVLEYWQEKAVFPETDDGHQTIKAAARPVHPLGKCIASVSLLATILVGKYADALPLYRLEGILKRQNIDLSRTSLAHWMIRLGDDVLLPLIHLFRCYQLQADYLQADETRLQVLKELGKAATSDKWMWVIRGGPPDKTVVILEYDASRSGTVPLRLLEGFQGVLQTDGYAGYNAVCQQPGITRIGCFDHVRRKFVEASKAGQLTKKKTKKGQVSKADVAIGHLRKLYRIEDKIKLLTREEKTEFRQKHSQPLLEEFKQWLEKNQSRVPKDSLTYDAIRYALNQWSYLIGYCDDGRLHMSNALAENAIRPFAVGRRNWLFADTPRGARASATCYSLIETAKANRLEPYAYITHVLKNIATADTTEKLEALLPWNVKQSIGGDQ